MKRKYLSGLGRILVGISVAIGLVGCASQPDKVLYAPDMTRFSQMKPMKKKKSLLERMGIIPDLQFDFGSKYYDFNEDGKPDVFLDSLLEKEPVYIGRLSGYRRDFEVRISDLRLASHADGLLSGVFHIDREDKKYLEGFKGRYPFISTIKNSSDVRLNFDRDEKGNLKRIDFSFKDGRKRVEYVDGDVVSKVEFYLSDGQLFRVDAFEN